MKKSKKTPLVSEESRPCGDEYGDVGKPMLSKEEFKEELQKLAEKYKDINTPVSMTPEEKLERSKLFLDALNSVHPTD
jgi:hypothetical protein